MNIGKIKPDDFSSEYRKLGSIFAGLCLKADIYKDSCARHELDLLHEEITISDAPAEFISAMNGLYHVARERIYAS